MHEMSWIMILTASTPLSQKNLIEVLAFVLTVVFTFFSRLKFAGIWQVSLVFLWKKKLANILIRIDS